MRGDKWVVVADEPTYDTLRIVRAAGQPPRAHALKTDITVGPRGGVAVMRIPVAGLWKELRAQGGWHKVWSSWLYGRRWGIALGE